jgi:DNA-binding protein HU-beta
MMNKLELVTAVAEKAGITKRDAERAVNALVESIEDALKSGDKVSLVGFGTFEVRNRRPRVGRNPQTGQEIRIPAGRVPSFKAGKALKELIS